MTKPAPEIPGLPRHQNSILQMRHVEGANELPINIGFNWLSS